jgi:hypothetical protein
MDPFSPAEPAIVKHREKAETDRVRDGVSVVIPFSAG